MKGKRHGILTCCIAILYLVFFTNTSALAGDINGIAGYQLGDTFDKKSALGEKKSDGDAVIYTVKPLAADARISILTIRLTKQQQIHRISAYSAIMTPAECQTRMDLLRKQTEKSFPMMGYYAMDQSELFYQEDRTYTLDCIKIDGGIRLRQEFSDDKLANLAE